MLTGIDYYDPNGSNTTTGQVLESNCPTNCWNLSSSLFPDINDFQAALENQCSTTGNFDFVFGENALAPIRDPGASNSLNALSHLSNTCNGLMEDFVMKPIFGDGETSRVISDTELLILCELGYKTSMCDGCYNTPEVDWGRASASYLNCCTPVFYFCPSDDIQELSHEMLLCNDTHNSPDIEITDVFPHNNTPASITITNTATGFEVVAPMQGTFGFYYTTKACDCSKMVNQYFEITVGPCLDCTGIDKCENLICTKGFEEFFPYTYFGDEGTSLHYELNGGYWHYIGGPNQPSLCNLTADNRFVVLNGVTDGLSFKLQEPILPGCTGTIEFLAGGRSGSTNETSIEVHGSEFPPCAATDVRNNIGCLSTNCTTGQAYTPFCFGEVSMTNLQQIPPFPSCPSDPGFISYTFSFTNISGQEVNNIVLNLANASTSVWIDDIIITQGCAFPDFEYIVDCNLLEVTFSNISESPNSTHLWNFGDGQSSTLAEPIHTYTASGQYTVTHTVFDDCGQKSQTQEITIEECATFCDPCGTDLDIDATGGIPFTQTTIMDHVSPFVLTDGDKTVFLLNDVCLSIRGQLIFESNTGLVITNGDIRMEEGAEILINRNASLSINESLIHGCEKLWRSIRLNDGATFSSTNSGIEDAQYAIRAEGNISLRLKNTVFDKNEVAVYAEDNGVFKSINGTITGNTFSSTAGLLPPFAGYTPVPTPPFWPTAFPYTPVGMVINDALLSVGNELLPGSVNEFTNLQNGIHATGSIIGVFYTQMNNFILPLSFAIATTESTILVASFNSFSETSRAITSIGGYVSLKENTLEGCGISASFGEYQKPIFYKNQINGPLTTGTTTAGIDIANASIVLNPQVTENNLLKSKLRINNISGGGGLIQDNTFIWATDDFITDGVMDILESDNLRIYENSFTLGADLENEYSLYISNSGNIKVKDNTIIGIGLNVPVPIPPGFGGHIRNEASNNIDYCCNTIADNKLSLRFSEFSNEVELKHNSFIGDSGDRGIRCDVGTILGPQIDHGNLWPDGGTAVHEGTDNEKFDSRFLIQDGLPLNPGFDRVPPFWPNSNVDPGWFLESMGFALSCEEECIPPDFPLTPISPEEIPSNTEFNSVDLRGARQAYTTSPYSPMLNWEAAKYLYRRINKEENLLGLNNEVDMFYTQFSNSPLATIIKVEKMIESAYFMVQEKEEALETAKDSILIELEYISYLDSLLNTSIGEDSIGLLAQKLISQQKIANQHLISSGLLNDIQSDRIAQVDIAASLNETIVASSIFETNEKTVKKIYLETVARGISTLDSSQFAQISPIAHQCVKEGGHIVLTARMLYQLYEEKNFRDEDICIPIAARKKAKFLSSDKKISLYPNPAHKELSIRIHTKGLNKICLYSVLGEKVFERLLNGQKQNLIVDISTLPSGLYFCTVFENGTTRQSKKLMINH